MLRLTDFKLLVQGMQSVTKRVGLNNSGLLLQVEVEAGGRAKWRGR